MTPIRDERLLARRDLPRPHAETRRPPGAGPPSDGLVFVVFATVVAFCL